MIPKEALILGSLTISLPLVLITTIGKVEEVKLVCAQLRPESPPRVTKQLSSVIRQKKCISN